MVFGCACTSVGWDFIRFMSHSCRCLFVQPSLQASGQKPWLTVYLFYSGVLNTVLVTLRSGSMGRIFDWFFGISGYLISHVFVGMSA